MFRKKCPNCEEKIGGGFNFCPICGNDLRKEKEESGGLLDEIDMEEENQYEDDLDDLTREITQSMGAIMNRFPFKQLINKLSGDIEKEFKELDKKMKDTKNKEPVKEGIQGYGSPEMRKTTFPGGFNIQIKVGKGMPQPIRMGGPEKKINRIKRKPLSKTQETKLAKLPREEPETKVRRLTDRIIYEIELPGVKNKKNIIINQLENSIEIRAFSKDRAFFKLIPVSMPVKGYSFKNGRLILELKPEA